MILGYPWGTPADIWSLGCLVSEAASELPRIPTRRIVHQITEWLIGSWLFEPNRTDNWSYEEDHLARMTEALDARFESSFLEKAQHRAKFFNPDGALSCPLPSWAGKTPTSVFSPSTLDRHVRTLHHAQSADLATAKAPGGRGRAQWGRARRRRAVSQTVSAAYTGESRHCDGASRGPMGVRAVVMMLRS